MSHDPTAADTTAAELPTLPTDRRTGCPFDPPAELTALSDQPVRRMRYADGHIGWLVTGHAAARAILADPRFSSRYELLHLPVPMEGVSGKLPPAPVGDIIGLDAPSTPATGACSPADSPSAACVDSRSASNGSPPSAWTPWSRPDPPPTW
jgi:hypothetical protein